jgi:hypothetical protein
MSESVSVLRAEAPQDIQCDMDMIEQTVSEGTQKSAAVEIANPLRHLVDAVSSTLDTSDQLLLKAAELVSCHPDTIEVNEQLVEKSVQQPVLIEAVSALVDDTPTPEAHLGKLAPHQRQKPNKQLVEESTKKPISVQASCPSFGNSSTPIAEEVVWEEVKLNELLVDVSTSRQFRCSSVDTYLPSEVLAKTGEKIPHCATSESDVTTQPADGKFNNMETTADIVSSDNQNSDSHSHDGIDINKQCCSVGNLDTQRYGEVRVNKIVDLLAMDVESLSHHELKLSLSRLEQGTDSFRHLDRPASVVIDLRYPKLIPVYTVCGSTVDSHVRTCCDNGKANGAPQRPQTAVRGRRRLRASERVSSTPSGVSIARDVTCSTAVSVQSLCSPLPDLNNKNHSTVKADSTALPSGFGASTIIHLKFVDVPTEQCVKQSLTTSEYNNHEPQFVEINAEELLTSPECSTRVQLVATNHQQTLSEGSQLSDDESMRVQNVNRTYSRNISGSQLIRNHPEREIAAKSKVTEKSCNSKIPIGLKEASPITSTSLPVHNTCQFQKSPLMSHGHRKSLLSSIKPRKRRVRIGPAWYSRQHLSAPPADLWDHLLVPMSFMCLKRANYVSGLRHRPFGLRLPKMRHQLRVRISEKSEMSPVGEERLILWRMTESDIDELQSQLRREADHRRTEHIMPLVMQMTNDQIESAYEGVTESMKMYEIIAADSDDDDDEEEEEQVDDDDELLSSVSLSMEVSRTEKESSFGETEYMRNRPKRLAVDYGPSAFAPILLMEGRRMFMKDRRKTRRKQSLTEDDNSGTKRNRRSVKIISDSHSLPDSERNYVQNQNNGHRTLDDGTMETDYPDISKKDDRDVQDTGTDSHCDNSANDRGDYVMTTTQGERRGVFDRIGSPQGASAQRGITTPLSCGTQSSTGVQSSSDSSLAVCEPNNLKHSSASVQVMLQCWVQQPHLLIWACQWPQDWTVCL